MGVKIDETLSGKGIIDTILKKCNGRIKFLYRQARCFPTALKKTLCQSLAQSRIDYAISSWYAAMSQKAKSKLQIIQKKMVRFILDLGPRTHITNEHMSDLNILRIPGRVEQLRLSITHNILQPSSHLPNKKLSQKHCQGSTHQRQRWELCGPKCQRD